MKEQINSCYAPGKKRQGGFEAEYRGYAKIIIPGDKKEGVKDKTRKERYTGQEKNPFLLFGEINYKTACR
jgi:hypothetical protein